MKFFVLGAIAILFCNNGILGIVITPNQRFDETTPNPRFDETTLNTRFDETTTIRVTGLFVQCIVNFLGSRTVSTFPCVTWVRKRDNKILSVGMASFTDDARIEITHNSTENQEIWSLNIQKSTITDSGTYECVIATTPKLSHLVKVDIIEDVSGIKFCGNGGVRCLLSEACIPIKALCNRRHDCGQTFISSNKVDNWDELFCEGGFDVRACRIWGCDQNCTIIKNPYDPNDRYPKCYCKTGYQLELDNKTCVDINECLNDNSECSQSCLNTPGSFQCTCFEGYSRSKDGQRCETNDPNPIIYYSTSHSIYGFDLRFRRTFDLSTSNHYIVGLALDNNNLNEDESVNNINRKLFWIEKQFSRNTGKISSLNRGDYYELNSPEDIEIDPITFAIYVADLYQSKIFVFTQPYNNSYVIEMNMTITNEFIKIPVSLALDSTNRTLYWADWGRGLGIQKSKMDGSSPSVMVSTSIFKPKALVLDRLMNKLYWTDFELGVIESIGANGENRKTVFKSVNNIVPYALAIFEDQIYFSNWTSSQVMSCSKLRCNPRTLFNGESVITDLQSPW